MEAAETPTWNPRYEAYARAHGRAPEAMLEHDDERWPGGKMCGFMVWVSQRKQEWMKLHGRKGDLGLVSDEDQASFTAHCASAALAGVQLAADA